MKKTVDDAGAAQPHGELVTDLLQRRLSCLALSESSFHDLVSRLLHSNNGAVADVVFHVRRSTSSPNHETPLPFADGNPNGVFYMRAHSCVLRRESDYFREILHRQADQHQISVGDQELQDDPDHLLPEDRLSDDSMDTSTTASSMEDMPKRGSDATYNVSGCFNMQEEQMPAVVGANPSDWSMSASTMNDLIGREVLAHVQAELSERIDDRSVRRPPEQESISCKSSCVSAAGAQVVSRPSELEYRSCKSSFASANGAPPPSEEDYHSCKTSFVSANGTSDRHLADTTFDDCSSSCSMSNAATHLPALDLNRLSLTLPRSDCQPRKSILLNNDVRKVSMSNSARKSVRFSLQQADIILPTSMAENCMPGLGTGGEQAEEQAIPEKGTYAREASRGEKGLANVYKKFTSVMQPELISKPFIKRRHTEVSEVMERGTCTASEQEKNKEDASTCSFKFFVVRQLTWTEPVLIGIMEWLYVGTCHVIPEDLPGLYDAADRAVITSLTWCIRRHSMPKYLHLALSNPLHCKALYDLCLIADCEELSSLKNFCEALQALDGQPKIVILETKACPEDACVREVLSEGFFVLDGHPLCVLKSYKASEFESPKSNEEPLSVLTFTKQQSPSCRKSTQYQEKSISKCDQSTDEQTWKVVVLDDDPAKSLYVFFKYVATVLSTRSWSLMQDGNKSIEEREREQQEFVVEEGRHSGAFTLQMITRFKVGSILVDCLKEAIGEGIRVREKRGAGPFIKGPSYCTSIVIEGDPWKILMAAKAIPYDMVGRSALTIRAPCVKTFSRLFHASHTFGVDLQSQSVVLVKPLYVLIKVLEFMGNLNTDAYEPPSTERTFIELSQPSEPF